MKKRTVPAQRNAAIRIHCSRLDWEDAQTQRERAIPAAAPSGSVNASRPASLRSLGSAPIDAIYTRSRASVELIARVMKVPVSANKRAPNPKKTIEFAGVPQRETRPNHRGMRRSSDKAAVTLLAAV